MTRSAAALLLVLASAPLLLAALQDQQASPALPQTAPDPRPQSAIPLPAYHPKIKEEFQTSDRCVACHNGLKTSTGEDVSIGLQWQASVMANSGRDPYWQASIRRESIDHPEATAEIEDDCSTCHMPVLHFTNRDAGRKTHVFDHFPLQLPPKGNRAAADGVSCAVCHQAEPDNLGAPDSLNGNLHFAKLLSTMTRPEYGPFVVDTGHQSIMEASTGGFLPKQGDQVRDPALCGSCHTLTTKALAPNGVVIAHFPEQRPFQEWQHSQFSDKTASTYQTCQQCHMPEVAGPAPVTALYGPLHEGMARHVFVGGNFILQSLLEDHRDDLATVADPAELRAAVARTRTFLQTQAARVEILNPASTPNGLRFDVHAENLTGHKLPTAYPSRRVWLHVTVRDAGNRIVFESGHLNPDGSIAGNPNDADPLRYEPHFTEITQPGQVEIYEPILGDQQGRVTTGLLNAVRYLKDNRLLPAGFDKSTAEPDIRVTGAAATDPAFNGHGSTVRYNIATPNAAGPFHISVELIYQPIGYRWAHNLAPYTASEDQRMVRYYEQAAHDSAQVLAHAEFTP